MIRSSAPSRHLLVRSWARCCAAPGTTGEIPVSISRTQTHGERASDVHRGFRRLATGNSPFPYHSQHQQLSSEYQPNTGQSPSQHYRTKNSFGSSNSMNNSGNKIQIRTVFIQTENTPNPESIKFLPSNTVRKQLLSSIG